MTNPARIANLVRRYAGSSSRVRGMLRGQFKAMYRHVSAPLRASALRTFDRLVGEG